MHLDRYTSLVGPNGAGKSTVLCALNIFFRETAESTLNLLELQEEDFHRHDTSQPVTVTVAFGGLSAEAETDFADYARQGELVVSAVAKFDPNTKRAPVLQYGQRKVIKAFARFFEADKERASASDLKDIYVALRGEFPDLSEATTKPKMLEALRAYEEAHPDLAELLPSEDQFYGFSKGRNRLAKHVQWVFVPAVKDVSSEQSEGKDTALGRLLARTVRTRTSFADEVKQIRSEAQAKYEEMLGKQQGGLDDLSGALKKRLAEWAHPDANVKLQWQQDPEKSIRVDEPFAQLLAGEGVFSGNLARFGHGLQRAYLLALLQELARTGAETEPKLVLAVEEPELYQHPPQCRHMSKVLVDLSEGNSQVLITTHSPLFVHGSSFSSVRMVRKDPAASEARVSQVTLDTVASKLAAARGEDPPKAPEGTLAKIHQALQPSLNEIFFAPKLVLVEGREDIAYLVTYMNLMDKGDDVRRLGCHFVAADRKSSLLIPYAIVRELGIPTFLMFDADTDAPDRDGIPDKHRKDNLALLRLAGAPDPDPWPGSTLVADSLIMWSTELTTDIASDLPAEEWTAVKDEVRKDWGLVGGLEKNPLFIAETLTRAWERGAKSRKLQAACERILRFCGVS